MGFFGRPTYQTSTSKKGAEVLQMLSTFVVKNAEPVTQKKSKYEIGLGIASMHKNGTQEIQIKQNWESVKSAKFEDDSNQREILVGSISETTHGTEVVLKGIREMTLKFFLVFWCLLIAVSILGYVISNNGYFNNVVITEDSSEPISGWMLFAFLLLFMLLPLLIYRAVVFRQKQAQYYLNRIAKEVFEN